MTPADRDRLDAEVSAHLADLDGSTASAVALLSGIPTRDLDQLGGVSGDTRRGYGNGGPPPVV